MPTLIRTIGDAVHAIFEATKSIWYKVWWYILVIMPMTKKKHTAPFDPPVTFPNLTIPYSPEKNVSPGIVH